MIGAGESGVGAALLARKLKYEVLVSDAGQIKEAHRSELLENKIPFEERGHTIDRLDQMDCIVKSPGVPRDAGVVRSLRDSGVPLISEIEFAARHCDGRIIAVTGSNGKTTTTVLCHHILREAGFDAALCGNVGKSFARQVATELSDWYVVEVSSFQLEDVQMFRPDVGILLNITPDHLDSYGGDFIAYADTKMRLIKQMKHPGLVVYNADDQVIRSLLEAYTGDASLLGVTDADTAGLMIPDSLPGRHNALNAACAIAMAKHLDVGDAVIQKALNTFEKPGHRMEVVATIGDVTYINDSKATNTDAVFFALDAIDKRVIWIAGGQDKGNDYRPLFPLVEQKVRALICLGIDNENLMKAFSSKVEQIEETTSMPEAVNMAASLAAPGDVILLSPACASFDLFDNYEDRGRQFRQAVAQQRKE